MQFSDLGLTPEILRALEEQGYSAPTPIQAQAIPAVLSGGDLMACAQTGTGKTAGFTLPILHHLFTHQATQAARPKGERRGTQGRPPRVLILTPTRELAAQVEESVKTYGKHLPLKSLVIFGGVGMNPQIAALQRGVDILVATPGRLLDHARQGSLDLSAIEILVLDEADRMLDMGFIHDIRRVLALLPASRQNLLHLTLIRVLVLAAQAGSVGIAYKAQLIQLPWMALGVTLAISLVFCIATALRLRGPCD